ncbi:MAG TPA: hypothetical protein VNT03_05780, partial [Baekduia sp.]|nr:hypothetical protein [Baekduia sp.]
MRLRPRPRSAILGRAHRAWLTRGRRSFGWLRRRPLAWLRRGLPEGSYGRPARSLPGVIAVLAVAALAGLAIRLAGGSDPPQQRRPASAPAAVIARGPVRVQVPPGWSSTDRPPRLPGITLARPVTLVNPRSKVEAVVDALPATSPTLLPAAFVHELGSDLPKPSTVRIGRQLEGYHYAGLLHPRVVRLLDVYVAPTTVGTVTVACLAEALESLVDGCFSVVSRLALARGRPLAPGPAAAFREVLAGRVASLDAADARARR